MLLTPTRIAESPWTLPAVSLLLVGMLVAFYAVVNNAAKAGELRRQATATQVAAVARCHALPSGDASRNCLKYLLDPRPAPDETVLVASR